MSSTVSNLVVQRVWCKICRVVHLYIVLFINFVDRDTSWLFATLEDVERLQGDNKYYCDVSTASFKQYLCILILVQLIFGYCFMPFIRDMCL